MKKTVYERKRKILVYGVAADNSKRSYFTDSHGNRCESRGTIPGGVRFLRNPMCQVHELIDRDASRIRSI